MQEQFCSYEISLKLKELGFDEECFGVYIETNGEPILRYNLPHLESQDKVNYIYERAILTPLWQQATDWFLKTYDIFITILRTKDGFVFLIPEIENDTYGKVIYEALHLCREQAILKAIELCQKE